MRLLGFPLEGCTQILAGACPEQGRMGEDDDGRDRRCPVRCE